MSKRYIDFISAYCDQWCERCAFTTRCSSFAVSSALAMCDGDYEAAMELAIGRPRVPGEKPQRNLQESMTAAAERAGLDDDVSDRELDAIGREMDERRKRIHQRRSATASADYAIAVHRWLESHPEGDAAHDPAMREALDVIRWDVYLIHVKILRALDGQDEDPGGRFWKGAVQSDWNGSAKVALLSIERSEAAWRVVAAATADEAARVLADSLVELRQEATRQFPKAMRFRRPGFDQKKANPSE